MTDDEAAYQELCAKLHESACAQNLYDYVDPRTGYRVFTKLAHLHRGYCCKSGCRHCPYNETSSESS